ncbi:MAG: hypothetical protein K2H66_05790, partial [Oscillospiraceae bacterium]|nr:hypothetical protein [Oscillospiraceae bacterium]
IQKVKNILKELKGIAILKIHDENAKLESILNHLSEIGYYSQTKQPDSKILANSDELAIYQWIINCMQLKNNEIVYILVKKIWVEIVILDSLQAVKNLWNAIDSYSKSITMLNASMNLLLEVSNDSRDEENYLFDKYNLS